MVAVDYKRACTLPGRRPLARSAGDPRDLAFVSHAHQRSYRIFTSAGLMHSRHGAPDSGAR